MGYPTNINMELEKFYSGIQKKYKLESFLYLYINVENIFSTFM